VESQLRGHRAAGGFLEPLESTSIHLIQVAITTLLDYITAATSSIHASSRRTTAGSRWNTTAFRDFLILHYYATERNDTPIWNYCRTMDVPDSLRHKMELFRQRGAS
jgi:tryptophan halogenase